MNDEELSAKIDTLIELYRNNQQWLKILARDRASEVVEEVLKEPAEYHLFEELDGEKSIGDVIESVPIPRRTVYNRLDEWQSVGIISKVERGRYVKVASLNALGLELPELEEVTNGEE